MPTEKTEDTNHLVLRDCLSSLMVQGLSQPPAPTRKRRSKGRKNQIKPVQRDNQGDEEDAGDVEELGEFIEYLASDIFASLPEDLRTLSYAAIRNDASLSAKYEAPLPTPMLEKLTSLLPSTITDSITTYNLLPPTTDACAITSLFLSPLMMAYVTTVTTPPPSLLASTAPRAFACELCDRDWIPLTYHHLIPRAVHAKVLKRGWHEEWRLNSVAWLCRACHSFVHGIAGHEELAREWYTVDLLKERGDVRRWAVWVSKVRWKAR